MNARASRTVANVSAVAAAVIFLGAPANAQPPAQGPASPSQNPKSIQVSFYTGAFGSRVKQNVAQANQGLSGIESLGTITWSADIISPYMASTQYPDRPNEFYVDIPELLAYTYTIAGYSLTFSQSADIQMTCEGWQTGAGVLTANAVVQPAYFDPDQFNVIADALHIPSLVQSEVVSALQQIPSGTFPMVGKGSQYPIQGEACSTLGTTTQDIEYDSPAQSQPVFPGVTGAVTGLSVSVVKVTRLANGGEYQPLETPHLSLWAFYSNLQMDLPPMVEGQVYVPTTNAVVQTPVPSANGELVLIAAMTYDGLSQEDCTFAVFGHSSNFGSGTQSLVTPKRWAQQVSPTVSTKPVWVTANGYQVTLQITGPPTMNSALPSNPAPSSPVNPVMPVISNPVVHP